MGVLGEAFPRRSRHHQKQSGERRVGNETLRSAQQIVVAIAHGAGDESCAVRARTGFGETEAHDHLARRDARKPFGLRSEEHTSELQSLMRISYAVFCLKKKK